MELSLRTLIACKSGSDAIEGTLRSLSACDIPDGYEETIVIENGGAPVSQSLIESFDDALKVRYLHVPEKGKSNALNVGLKHIEEGLIFFSDDDVQFSRNVLRAYYEAGLAHGPGHFFGGPFDVDQESPPPEWFHRYLPPSAKGCWYEDGSDIDDSFTSFLGFNWAAFTLDLKHTGGFNTSKGPGSETGSTGQETDMQRRLVDRGVKATYVPGARVKHLVPEEKCTPKWALRRSLRSGTKDGLNYAREKQHGSRFPPLWLFKASLNYLWGMLINYPQDRDYYQSKYWVLYHIGFVKGIWLNQK